MGILFAMEMIEGKDLPREIGALDFKELGKTAGLLMHLCKSLFGTTRYIALDLGFYILKALIELSRKGIFACALIKKRNIGSSFCLKRSWRHTLKRWIMETLMQSKGKWMASSTTFGALKSPIMSCGWWQRVVHSSQKDANQQHVFGTMAWQNNSTIPSHVIGISATAILWMITTISSMWSHP